MWKELKKGKMGGTIQGIKEGSWIFLEERKEEEIDEGSENDNIEKLQI